MATVEKLEKDRAKLTITIDADAFEKAVEAAYHRNAKQYPVPGFRKGKAPRKIIERMYGEGTFYYDAADALFGDAYEAALKENELVAVDQPKIDIKAIGKDGITYECEVQLEPEVTLGQYRGLEIEEPESAVTDEDVDAQLREEQEKNARFADVDRPVENGDRVTLDYSGTADGVQFEGGTAEDQVLMIGSGTFIPGFEEQMIGMKAGEERDLHVTFPEEYHAKDLAGKEAVFHVTCKQVQIKELPELDDEFAKDISEFDTLDELKADTRKKLQEAADRNKATIIENEALKAACRNASVEIPECMVSRQVDYMVQEIAYRLAMSGMKLEDYLKYTGSSMEQMRKEFHDEARDRVELQLVIAAVGKAEGLTCSEEELDKSLAEYAEQNGTVVEDLRKNMTPDDVTYFTQRAINRKAIRVIADSAVLVPAKKAEAQPEAAPEA